ncbi:MAG: DUF1592 domain-containing protein [Lentisphaeraceae bacterium]|nr:DUF1592 domain-containing protein [Lentisphaeraceae bacterium]
MQKTFILFFIFTNMLGAADAEFKNRYDFKKDIVPLLDKYCYRCHDNDVQKGDVNLSIFSSPASMLGERKMWLEALHLIEEEEMPTKKPLLLGEDFEILTKYIDSVVNGIDWTKVKNPGFEEPSRLNTVEYANTMRDLLGLNLPIEKYFLQDSLGKSGFSNDRGASFFSSDRLKLYMKIANRSLSNSLFRKEVKLNKTFDASKMSNGSSRTSKSVNGVCFNLEQMNLTQNIDIKTAGNYTIYIKSNALWKDKKLAAPLLYLYVDGIKIASDTIKADKDQVSSFQVFLDQGVRTIGVSAWKSSESGLSKKEWGEALSSNDDADKNKDGVLSLDERAEAARLNVKFRNLDKNKDDKLVFGEYSPKPSKKTEKAWKRLGKTKTGYLTRDEYYRTKLKVRVGDENISVVKERNKNFWSNHYGLNAGAIRGLRNGLCIQLLKIQGPHPYKSPFNTSKSSVGKTLKVFLAKAFRRLPTSKEVSRFNSFYKKGLATWSHEEALLNTLTAVLVSPKFLSHSEGSARVGQDYKLNDFELASRLSYFLWMSAPDLTLLKLAAKGSLSNSRVLDAQIERMLKDQRAKAFTHTFAEEWLGISELGVTILPVGFTYPKFNVEVISSSKEQTRTFVHQIFANNRPMTDFIDSDYTYLNRVMGQFYELDDWINLPSDRFVKVNVDRKRGGLLGQSSILTVTSSPTRTNPIVRGIWILENILGVDIPPPDPDAGVIADNAGNTGKLTLRQIFEEHRKNPNCASCHEKIDPVGFSMENYDGIGLWRETYPQGSPIDSSAVMPDGYKFNGALELRDLIMKRKDEAIRNISEKVFSFALGRRIEYFDENSIRKAIADLKSNDYKVQSLIKSIVKSYPFQYKRSPLKEQQ